MRATKWRHGLTPSEAKQEQRYESNTPRCETCVNLRGGTWRLVTHSHTVISNRYCNIGGFSVGANGCCDVWQGRDGSTIEPEPMAPVVQEFGNACAVCGRKFKTKLAAMQHTKDVHGVKP